MKNLHAFSSVAHILSSDTRYVFSKWAMYSLHMSSSNKERWIFSSWATFSSIKWLFLTQQIMKAPTNRERSSQTRSHGPWQVSFITDIVVPLGREYHSPLGVGKVVVWDKRIFVGCSRNYFENRSFSFVVMGLPWFRNTCTQTASGMVEGPIGSDSHRMCRIIMRTSWQLVEVTV